MDDELKTTETFQEDAYISESKESNANPYLSPVMDMPKKKVKKAKKEKKEKKRSFGARLLTAMVLGIVFGGFAAGGFYGISELVTDKESVSEIDIRDVDVLTQKLAELQKEVNNASLVSTEYSKSPAVVTDVTAVVEKVMPSMVSVTNLYEEVVSSFFGGRYTQENEASGSGIIVGENDTDYFIATNYHVIESTKKLTVRFADDSTAEAYVKGYEADIDIAVIAVKKENLSVSTKLAISVAEMGDSNSLRMGEPAIAIGNALGYGQSVTTGVISALNRDIDLEQTASGLIQTSAAINPGNSGGALLNIKGQVIGINSAKIGATTVEGIGFAIPISEVKDIIGELSSRVTREKVPTDEKGYLGITCQDYDLTSIGYPAGVYVASVRDDSPAKIAGMYDGDIITKIEGQSVSNYSELQDVLGYYRKGETVKLTVARRERGKFEYVELEVTLGDASLIAE